VRHVCLGDGNRGDGFMISIRRRSMIGMFIGSFLQHCLDTSHSSLGQTYIFSCSRMGSGSMSGDRRSISSSSFLASDTGATLSGVMASSMFSFPSSPFFFFRLVFLILFYLINTSCGLTGG
jgi:hypothetical protein